MIDFNKIEEYWQGSLSTLEQKQYEETIAQDEELKSDSEWFKDLLFVKENYNALELQNSLDYIEMDLEEEGYFASIPEIKEKSFKEDLDDVGILSQIDKLQNDLEEDSYFEGLKQTDIAKNIEPKAIEKNGRIFSLYALRIAAGVLFLVGAIWFGFFRNQNNSAYAMKTFSVQEKMEQLDAISPKPRSVDKNMSLLFILKKMNKNSNDSQIESLFSQHFSEFPNDDSALMYQGIYLLMKKNYSQAVVVLEKVDDAALSIKKNEKEWGLGLAYLELKNKDRALLNFNKIENDSPYFEEAQKLKNTIK